ncbi:MAG: geranylgeranyl diphosphate synthase, type [Mycobacteriales bacterium]|jgi:geranylgeranyl diphosphate synthase type I
MLGEKSAPVREEPVGGIAEPDRMPTPALLNEVRQRIDEVLRDFTAAKAQQIPAGVDIGPAVRALADFVLTGGKRIRAQLGYWGWRGAGGEDDERDSAYRAGAALELCHCFGLIHDDIIDASETRRGRPTLHRQLAQLHSEQSWRGSSDAFGNSTALLLGDLCLFWADELLTRACGPDRMAAVRSAWHEMRVAEVCGQMFEMVAQAGRDFTVATGLAVARYKTALYATARPLQVGGALAGAPADLLRSYLDFGTPLGEAFQLRDDILGVFGKPEVTGKSATDDLLEGKPTVLIARALDLADADQRAAIDRLYGDPDLDEDGATVLREAILTTGAKDSVEEMIKERVELALATLADSRATGEARRVLSDLALMITDRDS